MTRKKLTGKAASNAIRSCFYKLCDELTPEEVTPGLFSRKVITKQAVERATNKFIDRGDRAQTLLLDLMGKVEGMPHCLYHICEVFDAAAVPSVQAVKGESHLS